MATQSAFHYDSFDVMDGTVQCCQRDPEGPFQISMWIPSAKRLIRKSLKTRDPAVARSRAMEAIFEALATQKAGLAVFSETLGDLIRAWDSYQRARLKRGEIRSIAVWKPRDTLHSRPILCAFSWNHASKLDMVKDSCVPFISFTVCLYCFRFTVW